MNKTDLSKYNNDWYKNSELTRGKFVSILWFLTNNIFLNSYLPIPVAIKRGILRLFGAKIGKNVMIKHQINIKYPWNLEVGNEA
jgi:putative colanic acid biosynthesis acetyltransferase WcaF